MADRVKVRRLTPAEGQRLQRIVRRGESKTGGNVVRWRRATILLASASGNTVPVIARLVAADEDTVREAIHRFNEIGLDCLDPHWAGGRPRLLNTDEENLVLQTALTRPEKLGQPNTGWSIRKLDAYLREHAVLGTGPGREALRCLLHRHSVTFQRTGTWKDSNDPDLEAKLEVIDDVLEHHADRAYAFDEFEPLGIRPTAETHGPDPEAPTSCRPIITAPPESPTSTAATASAMTPSGVSTAGTRAAPKASPRSRASEPMPRTASRSS